jgi:hypothetical protein
VAGGVRVYRAQRVRVAARGQCGTRSGVALQIKHFWIT